MNSMASPDSRRSSSRIAMTSAWVVTSSAVVGSSASSRRGSVSSAAAIMTRCSIPPDISCGYCRSRRAPSSMPTWASMSTARRRASRRGHAEVGPQRLGHEVADPPDRVDVRARVLEDHRHLAAVAGAGPPRPARRRPGRRTGSSPRPRAPARQQTVDRPGRHRLARAGLADQADAPRPAASSARRRAARRAGAVHLQRTVRPRPPAAAGQRPVEPACEQWRVAHPRAAWACSNSRSPSTLNAITTATMQTPAASAGSG